MHLGTGTVGARERSGTLSATTLLAHPALAACLGVAVGAGAIALTRQGVSFVTPDEPEIGVARAMALSVAGMAAAFVGLLGYFLLARGGLVSFGLGLVGGFVAPAYYFLFSSVRHAR